jgi:hypothetical protein
MLLICKSHKRNKGGNQKVPGIQQESKHNLSEPMEVLRGKFIAMSTYIKNTGRSQINNIMMHFRLLIKTRTS